MNKLLDLQAYLYGNHLNILAITEKFLGQKVTNGEIISSGYNVFRRDRNCHGGGVMLIVNDSSLLEGKTLKVLVNFCGLN